MASLSGFKLLLRTPLDDAKSKQAAIPADGDFTDIAGLRAKSLTINSAEIDITSGSSNEWREILPDRGIRSFDISGSGVMDDGALAKKIESRSIDNSITWFRLVQSDSGNRAYTGKFKITSFSFTGNYDGSVDFEMSLMSSGQLTVA